MEDEVTEGIQSVTSIANELVGACRDLESRLREAEFLLLTLRREFATYLLSRIRESPTSRRTVFGIQDSEVLALVKRYQHFPLSDCARCHRRAPIDDQHVCAWGCSPRSPLSMAP